MDKISLSIVLTTAIAVSGCAALGRDQRLGINDGNDLCYNVLANIDNTAIYYKDQRLQEISAGVLVGGGSAALISTLAGGDGTTTLISGFTGAIVGGFAADAYWKNKLAQVNNQQETAGRIIEADMRSDLNRLTQVDKDIAELVRCRTEQRDRIRRQFAEKKMTLEQARQAWKKWGDLIHKDMEEMKYLNEALVNVKKIEQSYGVAAAALDASTIITADMQKKWQDELHIEEQNEINKEEVVYLQKIHSKKIKSKEKKKIKKLHEKNKADIRMHYASKAAQGYPKKANAPKLLLSSVHEKIQSTEKGTANLGHLSVESKNQDGFIGGFEEIKSKLAPFMNLEQLV